MDSEKKEGWTNAKIKFDKIFAKLTTQIETEKISTIKQTIGLVKEYYEALDEAQTSFVKILMNDGKSEDIKRLNTELAEIETDMEETIALANNIMSKKSEENVVEKKEDEKKETMVECSESKEAEISSTKGRPVIDSDEEEDQYNEAKEKFEKLFAKLEKQTKKQQTSTLSKTIQDIKEAWMNLEKSQSKYVKRLRKAGNKEDASRVNKENVDLEAEMDEQIFLAQKLLSGHEKVEPEKRKITELMQEEEEYNEAKDTFENLFAKLERQILKKQTSNLNKTIDDIKKSFMDLEKLQLNYTKQLRKAGNKDEASTISKETAKMEEDMEEQISLAKRDISGVERHVEIVELEADTDEEIEEVLSEDQEPKKIKSKGVIQKVQEGVQQIKEGVENVGQNIANTLSKILVSKKQFEDFQIQLKDALVSEWDETAESKVFQGVQVSRYADFLKLFKKSTKVDDEILAEFETMEFTDRMDDKVKTFTCQGTDTGGKYGLYMAVKRPGEDKIDVAYAMYTYKAKFVGSSKAKPNQYKIWHAESAKDGLYRLTKPLVENILTGKMMEPDRFFRKADIDELAENFIVAKALQAFAHYGIIQKVSFVEDEDKDTRIEQQSKPMLQDKTR